METFEDIKKRIRSADDLYSVVRTMKTLSAVSIRHYERAVRSAGDYYHAVELGLQVVLQRSQPEMFQNPLSEDEEITGVLIFGSDQGLCGSYNDRIASYAEEKIYNRLDARGKRVVSICVGSRLCPILEGSGHTIEKTFPAPNSPSGVVTAVHEMLPVLNELREQLQINKVIICHNRLLTTVSYEPHLVILLPLDREELLTISRKKWPTKVLPAFTMDRQELFSELVREYVFVSLFRAFAESMASENAARLASMQAAERNIEERIDELNALFRRKRQDLITSELLDIISGFEALQSSKSARGMPGRTESADE